MLEQDYLMRQLLQLFAAIARAHQRREEADDPLGAAEILEQAIGEATDMDGATLLSLSPETIAHIVAVSGIDPNVVEFVARSMLLESVYLSQAGRERLANLRAAQAQALAKEFAFELPPDPSDFDALASGLEEAALQGGFDQDDDVLDAAMLECGLLLDSGLEDEQI